MRIRLDLLALTFGLAVTQAAHAETVIFTLTGVQTGTFQMSSTPTPDHVYNNEFAEFDGINLTNSNYGSPMDFYFELGTNGGGFADTAFLNGFYGAQTFSGSLSAPVFMAGSSYSLTSTHGSAETLTITSASVSPVSTTPEPSSFALLFTGLATTAFRARRKGWRAAVSRRFIA